jgi:uncharacterized protein
MRTNIMKREVWTLLALSAAGGEPLSPVQLQKSVFLFGKLLPKEATRENFYEFTPYNYGPFCLEVYKDADLLAERGLVDKSVDLGRGYSQYRSTANGQLEGDTLLSDLSLPIQEDVKAIVEWVKTQSFRGLVSAIYEKYPEYKVNSVFTG